MPHVVKGGVRVKFVKNRGCEDEGGGAGEVSVRRWSEVQGSMLLKMKEKGSGEEREECSRSKYRPCALLLNSTPSQPQR